MAEAAGMGYIDFTDPLSGAYCDVCHNLDHRGPYRFGTSDTRLDGKLTLEDRRSSYVIRAGNLGCTFCGLLCRAFDQFIGQESTEDILFDIEIAQAKPCRIIVRAPKSYYLELYAPQGMHRFRRFHLFTLRS